MLHDLVYILAAITLVFVFLFRLVGVKKGARCIPAVRPDYLVLESNFLYRTVRQGDIVVIDPPQQAQLDSSIVKRVVARRIGPWTLILISASSMNGEALDPATPEPTYRS